MSRARSLFSFRQGDHACVFYSDQRSLLDVLTPYIAEGLRRKERCFCVQKPGTIRALAFDLQFLGIDLEEEAKRGRFDFHTIEEFYFRNNHFEPEMLMEQLNHSIEDSLRHGFSGLRTAGELSWAVAAKNGPDCDRLIGYEKAVQAAFPGKRALGICQYPLQHVPPLVLDRLIAAHSHTLDTAGPRNASLCMSGPRCDAEIVTDRFTIHPAYQYVVQLRNGEHLWGNSEDFAGALRAVEDLIAAYGA